MQYIKEYSSFYRSIWSLDFYGKKLNSNSYKSVNNALSILMSCQHYSYFPKKSFAKLHFKPFFDSSSHSPLNSHPSLSKRVHLNFSACSSCPFIFVFIYPTSYSQWILQGKIPKFITLNNVNSVLFPESGDLIFIVYQNYNLTQNFLKQKSL